MARVSSTIEEYRSKTYQTKALAQDEPDGPHESLGSPVNSGTIAGLNDAATAAGKTPVDTVRVTVAEYWANQASGRPVRVAGR